MLRLSFEVDTVGELNTHMREYVAALAGSTCGTILADENGKLVSDTQESGPDAAKMRLAKARAQRYTAEVKVDEQPVGEEKPVVAEKPVVEEKPVTQGSKTASVTLDNLSAVPYDMLLAFCAQNPDIGIDGEKCKAPFFRQLVESKVKTFLTK